MAYSAQSDSTRGLKLPALPHDHKPVTLPPPPVDFLNYPVFLPKVSFLAELNYHARDQNLSFRSQDHTYFINDIQSLGSVTGLVASHYDEFDADEAIRKMTSGSWWPRPGYLKSAFTPSDVEFLPSSPDGKALRVSMLSGKASEEQICEFVKDLKITSPHLRDDIVRLSKAAPEIKAMWQAMGKEAANRGTWMHLQFEFWLNGAEVTEETAEMRMFFKFLRSLNGLTAYRTEWAIYGEEERLAGTIDFVAKDSNGRLVLFDWKRTKQITQRYFKSYHQMHEPLEHIADCVGLHYRLQLNCYKYLLQKYYGFEVSDLYVVCTHPDNGDKPFVDLVPVMLLETEALMNIQKRRAIEVDGMYARAMKFMSSPTLKRRKELPGAK